MIRVERDPAFWQAIAAHPALATALMGLAPSAVGALALDDAVLPLAAEHGGYLFVRMDPLGFVAELHSLFTPDGWGREALSAARGAIRFVWRQGFQLVVTHEVEANPRSRPPRTFGFTRAGDWRETPFGNLRLWTVSRTAWELSPAAKRRTQSCL